jgi:hypothetical protein
MKPQTKIIPPPNLPELDICLSQFYLPQQRISIPRSLVYWGVKLHEENRSGVTDCNVLYYIV